MPQNNQGLIARLFGGGAQSYLGTDAQGGLVTTEGSVNSTLDITAATLVKASAGRVAKIIVLVAGSAPGTVNDLAAATGEALANEVFVIPNTVGVYSLNWPMQNGIVVVPGTGQTLAVSWY